MLNRTFGLPEEDGSTCVRAPHEWYRRRRVFWGPICRVLAPVCPSRTLAFLLGPVFPLQTHPVFVQDAGVRDHTKDEGNGSPLGLLSGLEEARLTRFHRT